MLEWEEYCDEQGVPDRWDAKTPFGTYYEIELTWGGYSAVHDMSERSLVVGSLELAKEWCHGDCTLRCTGYLNGTR